MFKRRKKYILKRRDPARFAGRLLIAIALLTLSVVAAAMEFII